MYLAISALAAMCAILAAVQTRNAKRLGADLRTKTVEAESFQLAARTMEDRLHTEEMARMQLVERCTKVEQALRESEDTACRLRQEVQTERKKYKEVCLELDFTKVEHDHCINELNAERADAEKLKQENGKLTEALNTEREAAEHWKEEFHKEQAFRLSTEGRIMREVNNLLRYDGTANGQEDLSDE